jgi:serine/threonine protein kinase
MSQLRAWEIRLSEEVGDLLQWMLSPNPIDRPSLAQVMMHDWVIRGEIRPPT